VKLLAKITSSLKGNAPLSHIAVLLQLPVAIANLVAIITVQLQMLSPIQSTQLMFYLIEYQT
jgi:hypothetical protein